nr:mitochondrial proton/calcium exchanger protein-like [Tanacetum cinerariifolium]
MRSNVALQGHLLLIKRTWTESRRRKRKRKKKKQSVDIKKDVLKEMINATAADAQQQARAIALDKQQQLCKVSEALAVLVSASSSVSREREAFLKLVNETENETEPVWPKSNRPYSVSMMHKEGADGGQDIMKAYKAADEEINDSSDEHVPDGASSPRDEHVPDGASSPLINLSTPTSPTLCNISRATLSSLPNKVVGITSLPSEDSVSERQEELTKYPDEKDLKKLAKALHLDKSRIIRWFCYTRHDIKRKGGGCGGAGNLSSCSFEIRTFARRKNKPSSKSSL